MSLSTDQNPMPVAFISSASDQPSDLSDLARRICTRHDIDPDAASWPDIAGIEPTDFIRERIAASRLFVGIYQTDTKCIVLNKSNGGGKSINATEFELETACELLKKEDVLCFVQSVTPSQNLEAVLRKYARKYTTHGFDSPADFQLLLDKAIKDWRGNLPSVDRGSELSIQIECRDRYGVLASLADRIFREGGNILRAEHRSHHNSTAIRIIANWPIHTKIDPRSIKGVLERSLKDLFGVDDAIVSVTPVSDGVRMVTNRSTFKIMFWDAPGVAKNLFDVMASEKVSVIESQLVTIPATPQLGRIDLIIDSGGAPDNLVGLIQDKLKRQSNVFMVERSTERGQWWY